MQAGHGQAVGPGQLEGAHGLATREEVADPDAGGHRLVGGPGRTVVDDDHATSRDGAGERHPPGQRGAHPLTDTTGQVDAAVARAVGVGRRVEGAQDLGLWLERPHPDRNRVHGGGLRPRAQRGGDEHGEQERDDDGPAPVGPDRVGEWVRHGSRVAGAGRWRVPVVLDGGEGVREARLWTVSGPSGSTAGADW